MQTANVRDVLAQQEDSAKELLESSTTPSQKKRGLLVLVAAGLIACLATLRRSSGVQVQGGFLQAAIEEEEAGEWKQGRETGKCITNHCAKVPWLHPDRVVYSNLGNHGPDQGAEGMVYQLTDVSKNSSTFGKKFLAVINATSSDYRPAEPEKNGKWNDYAAINLEPGKSGQVAKFMVRLFDKDFGKEYYPPFFSMTFFDFDRERTSKATESLQIHDYAAFMTSKDTELTVTHGHGPNKEPIAKFAATNPGTGEDNAVSPKNLTSKQMDRAVSIVFNQSHQIDFQIAVEAGNWPRYFLFTFGSEVSCAVNQDSGTVETLKVYTPNRTAKFWSGFCSARDEKPKTASPHHSQNYLYPLLAVIAVILVLLGMAALAIRSGVFDMETCTFDMQTSSSAAGTAGTEKKTLLTGSPAEGPKAPNSTGLTPR